MDSIVQDAKQQLDLQMLNKIEKFKGINKIIIPSLKKKKKKKNYNK